MRLQQYQNQELKNLLNSQLNQNTNGVLTVETQVSSLQKQRSGVLIIHNGALIYGGSIVPNNLQLAESIDSRINKKSINATLSAAGRTLTDPKSVQELLEILVQLEILTWKKINDHLHNQIILMLERFVTFPVKVQYQNSNDFDLIANENYQGFNWQELEVELNYRRIQWSSLASKISSMDTVPYVSESNLLKVSDPKVISHFHHYVDGQRTLLDIALAMNKDPLKVAKSYFNWANSGMISFDKTSAADSPAGAIPSSKAAASLPTILSVDDSPIVQLSIKRALTEHYNVLCINNSLDALNILSQKQVDLILLDLTMPDMDGLDFCKTIRKIPKFKNLPIIMVTARDGLINKMKGQMAGTNGYMTKPFKPDELIATIQKYVVA
ncbi:response regulator with CheY-like receiver domain and winged-helix DNA-binding domain [Xenococcus sp. PCC 7305]|uniref:response regulator n=1 Tax=Xenococcus sp. PCC 7305 TaxID=102125 RepID=UPI0002ACBAEE|nr:response regulator [Xenococcus sp. PCC 7305]ELS02216.1 response regulator with CheY-like receiver domain and winged-helix DNA-binding domain [Xenococcus sp. PCC 7305]